MKNQICKEELMNRIVKLFTKIHLLEVKQSIYLRVRTIENIKIIFMKIVNRSSNIPHQTIVNLFLLKLLSQPYKNVIKHYQVNKKSMNNNYKFLTQLILTNLTLRRPKKLIIQSCLNQPQSENMSLMMKSLKKSCKSTISSMY